MNRQKTSDAAHKEAERIISSFHGEFSSAADLKIGIDLSEKHPLTTTVESTDFLKKTGGKLSDKLRKIPDKKSAGQLDEDTLLSMISDVSQLEMALRNAYIQGPERALRWQKKTYLEKAPIIIGQPAGALLCLSLPALVGRYYKGSYNVYFRTKLALEEYFSCNNSLSVQGKKILLIYKKYTSKKTLSYICDNDNWEMKRVTNAISETLNYSDNAFHFSILYTTVFSSADCVEALLIEQDRLPDFRWYLAFENPIQPYPKPCETADFYG